MAEADDHDLHARIDRCLDRVDAACDDDAPARRALAIEAVIRELEARCGDGPAARYALGYAWYFHPERARSAEVRGRVDALLNSVLAERPEDALAWLYLGHNRYDVGALDAAEPCFARAAALSPPGYMGLKAHEMLACCAVSRDGLAASLDALERFVVVAEGADREDVVPSALAAALSAHAGGLTEAARSRATTLAARLDRAGGFEAWFSALVARAIATG